MKVIISGLTEVDAKGLADYLRGRMAFDSLGLFKGVTVTVEDETP